MSPRDKKTMKTLLIILILSLSLHAIPTEEVNKTPSLMECEMNLEMFRFSVDQGNPITKEQLTGAIEACDGQTKHQKVVDTMKELVLTF